MLLFILQAADIVSANLTESSASMSWPGCRCIRVVTDPGKTINETLHGSDEPFFMVLEAGDRLIPGLVTKAERWLDALEPREAGIVIQPAEHDDVSDEATAASPPLFWRTSAIRDGITRGFTSPAMMPFGQFLLPDKKYQLEHAGWTWRTVHADAVIKRHRRKPGWQKPEPANAYVLPMLNRPAVSSPSTAKPFVTIVVCTYQNAQFLEWCIRSVLIQSDPAWELIIVDDGSSDHTSALLRECPLFRDPRIRVFRHESNRGKAFCLNKALLHAQAPWLMELDADDWLAPDCVAAFSAGIEANPDVCCWYADHAEWQLSSDTRLFYRQIRMAEQGFTAAGLLDRPIALAPRLYRVELLKGLDGWLMTDPFEGRLYEDIQILLRIMQSRNHPMQRIPQVLYHRRIRLTSTTQKNKDHYDRWKVWMQQWLQQDQPGTGLIIRPTPE